MLHVVCKLPNAAGVMRVGTKDVIFAPIQLGSQVCRVSEPLSDEDGSRLLQIKGFDLYRGDTESLEKLLADYKTNHAQEVARTEKGGLEQQVEELQRALSAMSDDCAAKSRRIVDLEEENAELKKEIGQPSASWNRARLAKYAEGMGLIVNDAQTKAEILEMIETRITQKG